MHQYSRSAPRSTSSPQSNPTRTNNQRNQPDRDASEAFSYTERPSAESSAAQAGNAADRAAKNADQIRQVTQNFFKRAALMIVSSRVNLTPEMIPDTTQVRSTKWFQIVFDESEELTDDVADWTMVDVLTERPQPLIIEIFLDTSELKRNQTLVVMDERKNKWDVCEALGAPPGTTSNSRRAKNPRVVLERWKVYLGEPPPNSSSASNEPMPNVYKKAITLFRSLYTYCRFLPAWKFGRMLGKQPATLTTLRPMYRILDEEPSSGPRDPLTTPLYPTADKTTQNYEFLPVKSPVGSYSIHVTYRINCDFHVDDSDALLSSHFMGMDDHRFQASLANASERGGPYASGGGAEVGSLPVDRRSARDRSDFTHAYGSLSTFHHPGHATGTSPISALRAARDMASDDYQEESPPQRPGPSHRTPQESKSSLRSEGINPVPRRISVSFQPFKQGSLSSSPAAGIMTPSTPIPSSSSTVRPSETNKRPSQTTLPQSALRAPPATATPPPEVAVGSPSSGSPKAPAVSRYSSSFGHRRSRFSSGGNSTSKAEEDNNSSGKASQSSSTQPGSGLLGEGESGSPGSMQAEDDDNISDFLKLLEQKKDLKSFNRTDDASRDASARRTTAALSKYRGMRESNAALGDSLSSSAPMQRSSSSSSRQLPPLAGASVSTSSSPGKAISPHTPYTPSVPSRLSEHSTIRRDESRGSAQHRLQHQAPSPDDSSDSTTRNHGSGAIPIPTSPQRYPYARRSSSAHQRHRTGLEGLEEFDRPASLSGLDARPELSLSELLHSQQAGEQITPADESSAQDETGGAATHGSMESQEGDRAQQSTAAAASGSARSTIRSRAPRRGSGSSTLGRGTRSFASRPNITSTDDEEPLLFTMSELNRRSVEEENLASPNTPETTNPESPASALRKEAAETAEPSYSRSIKKNGSSSGGRGSGNASEGGASTSRY